LNVIHTLISNSMIVLIGVIVVPCHQKCCHPKDILHNKNHLYRIVLVHLTSNVAFKKTFSDGWILNFLKNRKCSKFCQTASLPAHIHKPRAQTKHRTAAILQHNTNSPVRCAFWGSRQAWGLCTSLLLLSSIRLFFMQRNHIDVLIFPINTPLEQCI